MNAAAKTAATHIDEPMVGQEAVRYQKLKLERANLIPHATDQISM